MADILFYGIFIAGGFHLLKYVSLLQDIVDYSIKNNIAIFGVTYTSVYHLYADVSFFNSLWKKGCHSKIDCTELSSKVLIAHKMLRMLTYGSLLLISIQFINGVTQIG
jgi:hypothetical protein